jgi:hypothetical protein
MAPRNPNPHPNPKIERICEQLRDLGDTITEDMNSAALADQWDEVARLASLDERRLEIMRNIGCGDIAIVSPLDNLLMNITDAGVVKK